MKKYSWMLAALLVTLSAYSQLGFPPPPAIPQPGPRAVASPADLERDAVNYLVRVEWKAPKTESKSLEVLTAEGQFNLSTIEKNPAKINGNDVPTTLKFTGSIQQIGPDKARVKFFLGRTVPYITSTSSNGGVNSMSSYQQMSVGLDSSFVVKFGKAVVVQNDENGQISVLVTKQE